jgi:hypothetical protein
MNTIRQAGRPGSALQHDVAPAGPTRIFMRGGVARPDLRQEGKLAMLAAVVDFYSHERSPLTGPPQTRFATRPARINFAGAPRCTAPDRQALVSRRSKRHPKITRLNGWRWNDRILFR